MSIEDLDSLNRHILLVIRTSTILELESCKQSVTEFSVKVLITGEEL